MLATIKWGGMLFFTLSVLVCVILNRSIAEKKNGCSRLETGLLVI